MIRVSAASFFVKNTARRRSQSKWRDLGWFRGIFGFTGIRKKRGKHEKKEFLKIISDFEQNSINAVIGQVRASSDAFYKSKLSPWSEWLTGQQGQAPDGDFDPLKFMVKECHQRNMEFHAWFNPFRAVSHVKFSSVSQDHITRKKPE